MHNRTGLPTWAQHLPRLLIERRKITDLNRLTLVCVLTMMAVISIGAMVVIMQARWQPACGNYQECLSRETTELVDQSKELLARPPRFQSVRPPSGVAV